MLSEATYLNDKEMRIKSIWLTKKTKEKKNGYTFHSPLQVLTQWQSCELLPLVAAQVFITIPIRRIKDHVNLP